MARQFTAASTHYISGANAVGNLGDNTRTIAFWVRTADNTARQFIYAEGSDPGTGRFAIEIEGSPAKFSFNNGAASYYSTTTPSNDTWYHVAVIYNNPIHRIYVNGVQEESTTNAALATTATNLNLGRFYGGSLYLNGQLAEVAKWNIELSPGAVGILAKGLVPSKLERASLAFYAPLVRNVQDMKGLELTDNGPTTASDHPRTYR